jgi:hypothetical protein
MPRFKIYARFVAILVILAHVVKHVKKDAWTLSAIVSVLYLMLDRDFYLYFLDRAVFPCGPMQQKTPDNADTAVTVRGLRPDSNVVFWAAESSDQVQADPWKAYDANNNSGVTRTDADGTAVLRVRNPSAYKVSYGKKLEPHIHYRVCERPGMLGRVRTVRVESSTSSK